MQSGYYRFPTIHQETVVFVCEDDLWAVPTAGGLARRLTANPGRVTTPVFSPDGSQLAFTGRDEGEAELYVMPALGGPAKRLTFLGVDTEVVGWRGDGQAIIFTSNTAQPMHKLSYLYQIAITGGPAEQLPTGPAMSLSFGPHNGLVIGRNSTDMAHWKRYRGGLTGELWIDAAGDGDWQPLITLAGNVAHPCWLGERIYFVSDHEGVGNLYSCAASGHQTALQRHTHHADYYVRHPATDGQRIVYHAGADLYVYTPQTDSTEKIPVQFHSPKVQCNRHFVYAPAYLEEQRLHPNGHSVALITRGKPFSMANWERAVIQHGEPNGVRHRLINWLYEGKHLVMMSDAAGEEMLEIHWADNRRAPHRFEEVELGRPIELVSSPTANQLALTNQRNELLLIDLEQEEISVKQLDASRFRRISGVSWSPDGRWLAYSFYNGQKTAIIKLCEVESGQTHAITQTVLRDVSPAFDPDGKYLYFLSYREFDPIADNMQFDLSFPLGMRPFLITLQADLPSPFGPPPTPPPAEEPAAKKSDPSADDDEESDENQSDEDSADQPHQADDADKTSPKKPITIDLEGIQQRLIAFPVPEGRYGQIHGIPGKVLFTSYPVAEPPDESGREDNDRRGELLLYDFEERDTDSLVYDVDHFEISVDGKMLLYRSGNRLRVLKAGSKPDSFDSQANRKSGWLKLNRIRPSILPQAEWLQMYREAWRLQRDYFWTESMSDVDWQAIYERYLPLLERVATRSEMADLLWEMQGELGTSHAYVRGGDYDYPPSYYQGYLGADFAYEPESNSYLITHIVQGDSWNPKATSPLSQPGLGVKIGDRLIAVNGRPVSQALSPQELLVNQIRNEVFLTFAQDEGQPRTISVKTLFGEQAARYREWVNHNRQRVHEATEGRVGYVHIPDMGAEGYAEFHRGYLAEVGREGLIIDVRFNSGGNVSQLIMEKLTRKRVGYDLQRWGEPIPYPDDSLMGPMVALCNEHTASDGDVFSHAFKLLKLGPLIGTRTWGGVIGYAINETFVDGGWATQPGYAFWVQDVGWQLENYGTEPDIEVVMRPQDYLAQRDAQLERAIEEILKIMAANPPKLPDFNNRPSLSLPKLPKR